MIKPTSKICFIWLIYKKSKRIAIKIFVYKIVNWNNLPISTQINKKGRHI